MQYLGAVSKNDRMISVHFQVKPFNITVIQVYASNAKEADVEQFYEDLQDLLELTPKKDVFFITGDWNTKVGSQETPGVTGKFGLELQNEAVCVSVCVCVCLCVCVCVSYSVMTDSTTPWTVACQAPLSKGFSRQEYWNGLPFSSPKWSRAKANRVLPRECTGHRIPSVNNTRDDSTHDFIRWWNMKIRLIIFFADKDGEAQHSQQKWDLELTVTQIMSSLLKNSDLSWRK